MQLADLSYYWIIGFNFAEIPEHFEWVRCPKKDFDFDQLCQFYEQLLEAGEIETYMITDGNGLALMGNHYDVVTSKLEYELSLSHDQQ